MVIKASLLTPHPPTVDFQIDHLVSRLPLAFLSGLRLVRHKSLLIKCSRCTKALQELLSKVNRVAGKAMVGKGQTRIQLCHQLILLILKAMGIIRLTLLRWMTWFQAPPEKLMTLTR